MATNKIPANAQATLGTRIYWAAAVTAGTKPTVGYKQLPGITGFPKIGGAADSFETTTLDEDVMKTYILGLLDPGGTVEVTYNVGTEIVTEWKAILSAQALGKEIWLKVLINKPYDTMYDFAVQFSPLGVPELGINAVLQDTISMAYKGGLTFTSPAVVPTP